MNLHAICGAPDEAENVRGEIRTYVNVNARICLPEGSLSRFVERVLILASIGRYGTLICNMNDKGKEKKLHKNSF